MSKAIIILALLGLSTQITLAQDCSDITCGKVRCDELCEETAGCEWNEDGRSDINMPCSSPDSWYEPSCCISDTTTTTPAPSCPDRSSSSNPCYGLEEDCCVAATACQFSTSKFCQIEGGPECCEEITDEPTPEPTDDPTKDPTPDPTEKPTPSPTCPDNSGLADPCYGLSELCCPTDNGVCQYRDTGLCQKEGGPDCCYLVTPEPTEKPTPSPSEEPTKRPSVAPSDEPTKRPSVAPSDEPTKRPSNGPSDEPTKRPSVAPSDEPTKRPTLSPSEEPTTTTTTTKEPTPKPSPQPTTTTTEAEDETTTTPAPTTSNSWPTKRPTMHSAQKWTMIHPAYKGNDGELLWHVYYGDFSNDERFDEFRDNQLWDAEELRPIIQTDAVFAKYRTDDKGEAVLADSSGSMSSKRSSSHSFGWVIIVALILIGGFAYWYKYKGGKDTLCGGAETRSLLHEQPVSSYDYQPVH